MNDKRQHRLIPVGDNTMISLCETCQHMPAGIVPQSNSELTGGKPEQRHMYCLKKAFFPLVNYSNDGKTFYDVAKCDAYEQYKKP